MFKLFYILVVFIYKSWIAFKNTLYMIRVFIRASKRFKFETLVVGLWCLWIYYFFNYVKMKYVSITTTTLLPYKYVVKMFQDYSTTMVTTSSMPSRHTQLMEYNCFTISLSLGEDIKVRENACTGVGTRTLFKESLWLQGIYYGHYIYVDSLISEVTIRIYNVYH